jgi:hypothetical protein
MPGTIHFLSGVDLSGKRHSMIFLSEHRVHQLHGVQNSMEQDLLWGFVPHILLTES